MGSLDQVQNEFKASVGHKPHSVQQMLAYCKQNNIPWKFRDINKWWPTRPEPEEKPKQKAINADEYKDPNAAVAASDDDNDNEQKEEASEAPKDDANDKDEEEDEEDEDEEEE